MYSTTKCAVRQGNVFSDFFNTSVGVKQGDNLSPTLFNIFVDDFETYLDKVVTNPVYLGDISFNHLFFADDLVLFSETPVGLQNCLDILSKYCTEWKLHVNLQKTKVMVCSKKKINNCYGFYFEHSILDIVDKYKYLGTILQSNGSLKSACDDLATRARKAYFALKSKLPFGSELTPKLWLKLYESIIVPIITYSSEIWIADFNTNLNNLDKTPFEKIQNFIFKNIE